VGPSARVSRTRTGDNAGGELVFSAELRNALFDALGIVNHVWW